MSFENEKFSEICDWLHYIMLYSYSFDILFNLRFTEHNYFDFWVAKDNNITFHTRVTPRMNKRVMIDTISKDIDEETQSTN